MPALSQLRPVQPHAVDLLAAAVTSGRMHHAYLLVGPEEAGADAIAVAVATSLVCQSRQGADACGACAACRKVAGGNHPDVMRVVPDDKNNIAIDTVRTIAARLSLRAVEAPTKVALILQVDAMKAPAQNALLKTLEEPPGATCFLLTTSRLRSLLPTVRSRCQALRLRPLERRGAWRVLTDAGIDAAMARPLSALVGPDVARAQALVDQGAGEVLARLRETWAPNAPLTSILAAAQDLGAERDRADLALALIEVEVRDRLAMGFGADSELSYNDQAAAGLTGRSRENLGPVVERLQALRRSRAFNVNPTYAIESVLLTITGHLAAGDPAPGSIS